jgi:hypothetical protein
MKVRLSLERRIALLMEMGAAPQIVADRQQPRDA